MIEDCQHCGKRHQTEPDGPITWMGARVKVCPEIDGDKPIFVSRKITKCSKEVKKLRKFMHSPSPFWKHCKELDD